ncbi:MAG: SAM-dependent methyltransferase, partial [Actinomycetota bacterium]
MSRVVVVGLGPADVDLLTPATTRLIGAADHRFLRTTRHPAASVLAGATSFDDVYESADSFDEVYATIVDRLVAAADRHGEVLYAVPGSPRVLERTVEWLVADDRVETVVHPAMSFLDVAWARLGIDPVEEGVRLVDGHRFVTEAAGDRGPMLVAHAHARHVLSDIKLAVDDEPDAPVVVLQRLGLPDERITEVPWSELDRSLEPDHLTCLYLPELGAPVGREVVRLWELTRTLRIECPWDREQTHHSLREHLLEEAHETLEAIDGLDPDEPAPAQLDHLEEELGDLLFQVMIHSV